VPSEVNEYYDVQVWFKKFKLFIVSASGPWCEPSTLALIDMRTEYDDKFKSPLYRKNSLWRMISGRLQEMGYVYSHKQVESKWKTLLTKYREVVDNNDKSGSSRQEWKFLDKMNLLLGENHDTVAKSTLGSLGSRISSIDSANFPTTSGHGKVIPSKKRASTSSSSTRASSTASTSSSKSNTSAPASTSSEKNSFGKTSLSGKNSSSGKTSSEKASSSYTARETPPSSPGGSPIPCKRVRRSPSGASQVVDFLYQYVDNQDQKEAKKLAKMSEMHNEKMLMFKGLIDAIKPPKPPKHPKHPKSDDSDSS
jgi:hypothetical protein